MAIGFDAVSTGSGNTNSVTVSHTVGSGDHRLLVVGINVEFALNQAINSITYGGTSLTLLTSASRIGAGSFLFYLVDPPSGTADLVVELALTAQVIVGVTSWSGVSGTSPFRDFAGTNGVGTSFSVNVETSEGDVVIDAATVDKGILAQSLTADGGQTERWNIAQGLNGIVGGGSTDAALGGQVNMGWTALASDDFALVAGSLRPFDQCSAN